MSFKAWHSFANGRRSISKHIYKPRVLGEPQRSAPDLAEAFRKDARSAQVKLGEVEEEVGPLEKGIRKLMDGRPIDTPK